MRSSLVVALKFIRAVRRLLFSRSSLRLFVIFSIAWSAPPLLGAANQEPLVELKPTELDPRDSERRDFGKMELMSAYVLRSSDRRFGGWSGLSIGADGHLYAVSDRGYWFSARLVLEPTGKLVDLTDARIEPLLDLQGSPVTGAWHDAEALSRTADGSFIVGFEGKHRLWRYPAPPKTFSAAPANVSLPDAILRAPTNGGIECLAALLDDRLLVLTEEMKNSDGSFAGWVQESGRFERLSYVPGSEYRVTDCAALPNGDALALERRFTLLKLWGVRLTRVPSNQLHAGAKVSGTELLKLEAPLALDNFEAVAVQQTERGTVIYLVSDDNYSRFQQTLLLQFLLPKDTE